VGTSRHSELRPSAIDVLIIFLLLETSSMVYDLDVGTRTEFNNIINNKFLDSENKTKLVGMRLYDSKI